MKKKAVACTCLATMLAVTLTGCGGYDQVRELNALPALNAESEVSNDYSLSYSEKQNMVYAQVVDRTLLDLSVLEACNESELSEVISYLNDVDNILVGTTANDDSIIDSCFTDYLLSEFERTPYYWQRAKTVVRGIDSTSRSIVVDVTYNTIDFSKEVKADSKICLGEDNYDKLVETRYQRYCAILTAKHQNTINSNWEEDLKEWKKVYGDPVEIYKSQRNFTLTDNMYETGNQVTYTGCVDAPSEQSHGSMTVRYVLVPNYVLGINLGLACKHMYITEYKLNNDITADLELFTDEGYDTVTDSVYSLMYSYFNCIDESDFDGLYKLTDNFNSLDKYYSDMFDTTYRKHENFSLSVFNIDKTNITCGISVSSKIRAKGSNMLTMPAYTDRYYAELQLVDGTLKVKNLVLLSRTITGEPAITTEEAGMTGFVAGIDLSNEDRLEIEQLICDFGAVQLNNDTVSDAFGDVVDLSMTTAELTELQTAMTTLTGKKKAVWIQNYQYGNSNYASVKCKELYQDNDDSIVEAYVTYDFILKGDRWYVYKYDVNSSVRLDSTNLATGGCLCLVSPGKVEAYTSQVQATQSNTSENVSDISVEYTHDAYEPELKTGGDTQEEVGEVTPETLTQEDIDNSSHINIDLGAFKSNYETGLEDCETKGVDSTVLTEGYSCVLDYICLVINMERGIVENSVAMTQINSWLSSAEITSSSLKEFSAEYDIPIASNIAEVVDLAINSITTTEYTVE